MRLSDYQDATLRTIFNAVNAFYELEETHVRESWERTRWQTCTLLNIQLARKDRMDVFKLLPLPWDENRVDKLETKKLTYDEQKEYFEKLDAAMKNRKMTLINGDRRS